MRFTSTLEFGNTRVEINSDKIYDIRGCITVYDATMWEPVWIDDVTHYDEATGHFLGYDTPHDIIVKSYRTRMAQDY